MADTNRIARTREQTRRERFNNSMTVAYDATVEYLTRHLGRRPLPAEVTAAWAAWLATYEGTD